MSRNWSAVDIDEFNGRLNIEGACSLLADELKNRGFADERFEIYTDKAFSFRVRRWTVWLAARQRDVQPLPVTVIRHYGSNAHGKGHATKSG